MNLEDVLLTGDGRGGQSQAELSAWITEHGTVVEGLTSGARNVRLAGGRQVTLYELQA